MLSKQYGEALETWVKSVVSMLVSDVNSTGSREDTYFLSAWQSKWTGLAFTVISCLQRWALLPNMDMSVLFLQRWEA